MSWAKPRIVLSGARSHGLCRSGNRIFATLAFPRSYGALHLDVFLLQRAQGALVRVMSARGEEYALKGALTIMEGGRGAGPQFPCHLVRAR